MEECPLQGLLVLHLPMPSAKLGYSSSVKRGSGSSRKYSLRVPAMALTSISLIITDTSLLSEREESRGRVKELLALHSFFPSLWVCLSFVSAQIAGSFPVYFSPD